MKKHLLLTAVLTSSLLSGCTTQPIRTFESPTIVNLNHLIQSGEYQQKADVFYAIMDASSSMVEAYQGNDYRGDSTATKFAVEKEILRRINKSAKDLKLGAGIRSFGYAPCLSWEFSELNYGSDQYSPQNFAKALGNKECTSSASPMSDGLSSAEQDLRKSVGKISMLVISDGMNLSKSPLPAAKSLKNKYGDRLCLYTLWVGNAKDQAGQAVLAELANIGGCGFATSYANIASEYKFDEFTKGVFLTKNTPAPVIERAPPPVQLAPPPAPVDGDDDQDGVRNSRDKCPKTPRGATVNIVGCWIIEGVHFDFDKSIIKPMYYPKLDNVVNVIKQNPGLNIEIQGHTDGRGTPAYNIGLSNRRAIAVKDYLTKKVDGAATLSAKGYGLTQPIDTNKTDAGRANNRRVQLNILE